MTFFLESKRNTDFPIQHNPSPFQYSTAQSKKKSNSYAPFSSTTKLNRTIQRKDQSEFKNKSFVNQQKQYVIDEEAIREMASQKMASMFKSRSQRFISSQRNIPGPGSYQVSNKNKIQNKQKYNRLSQKSVITFRKQATPSIPLDNLGYKFDKDNKIKKVEPKKISQPTPGSYELRKDLIKQNGLIWKEQKTINRKQEADEIPGPGHYSNQPLKNKGAPTSCFESTTNRFNQKKIKKNIRPGPGDYTPNEPKPFRQLSQSHFNSKAMRFKPSSMSGIGPGSYFNDRSKSTRNFKNNMENKSQIDANRKTLFSMGNKNPGPGQYIARDGMTFQLQKALLRKHNLSQFANAKRQLFADNGQILQPGPGTYNPEIVTNNKTGNLGYKKAQVVNLKEGDQQTTPSPFNYTCNNYTISKKVQQSTKKLMLTDKKPFDSGAERFKHYGTGNQRTLAHNGGKTLHTDNQSAHADESQGNQMQHTMNFQDSLKKTKKLIMTSVKVKVPFGSSTAKFSVQHQDEQTDSYLGPGAYQVAKGVQWMKPTFSIKGKLQ